MSVFLFQVAILGACVGSFLNVVIYRLPRNISFLFKRSYCPTCNEKLKVFDLAPIISWALLQAKCRYCRQLISFRYPLVEITTAFLFLLCLISNGFSDNSAPGLFLIISGWILVSYLLVLCLIDIDEMILPDSLTYTGSALGLFLTFSYNLFIINSSDNSLIEHVVAFLLAIFCFTIFSHIVKIIIKKPALGLGDSKLFAMSGAWLGIDGLEVVIVLSFLISAVFVLFGFLFGLLRRSDYIPFGPYICFSILLVWILGSQFWIEALGDVFWWRYL